MPKLLRYAGSTLVLVGGAVHLYLYATGYRNIPNVGVLFLLNVFAALFIAVALATRPIGAFAVAALAFSGGSIAAFVLSRTTGFLGFMEIGWDPRSTTAFAAEVATVVLLAVWFKASRPRPQAVAVVGEREGNRGSVTA